MRHGMKPVLISPKVLLYRHRGGIFKQNLRCREHINIGNSQCTNPVHLRWCWQSGEENKA